MATNTRHACRWIGHNVQCRGGHCDINLDYVKDPTQGEFVNDFEINNEESMTFRLKAEFCLKSQNC
jgi:hypothetical protein